MRNPGHTSPFAALAIALMATVTLLAGCVSAGGDTVERFADATPSDGASIAIPGYRSLSFDAGKTTQAVHLTNPPENACTFVLSLTLDEDGTTLWEGEALSPGEAFTSITLVRALEAGEYAATLHYNCFSLQDNTPLNGAEIRLQLNVQ